MTMTTIAPNSPARKTVRFNATHADGRKFVWHMYREPKVHVVHAKHSYTGPMWMLATHDGCIRGLERTWHDSVADVHMIAANYGCTVNIH